MKAQCETRGVEAGTQAAPALERLLSPKEIASALQLDESTVRRIFQDEVGVFKLANGGGRKRRSYVTLRVPMAVYERVMRERTR